MNLTDLSIEQIIQIREDCNKLIKNNIKKENEKSLNNLEEKIKEMYLTDRVHNFYEKYRIEQINFLYRSMVHSAGNNINGSLSVYEILSYDKEMSKKLEEVGIRSYHDLIMKENFNINKKDDKQNQIYKDLVECKLLYLYNFFLDIKNVINYQGAFNTFLYVTDYLNNILTDSNKSDIELINENWDEKVAYLSNNLIDVANYLLECRNLIPNARLSICNTSLSRTAKKTSDVLTFNDNVLISALAFGTTLDKLENKNYEDCKKLIYVPYKKCNKKNRIM